MPDWRQVTEEIQSHNINPLDSVRRKYLKIAHEYTGRNVIAYYSAFMQKNSDVVSIDDNDMNSFMQTIHGLDKSKGLDLILHTPGGNLASAVSIITYLHSIFGNNIRVIVPQLAMSAGTMIALSSKEIIMGKESALGPIDPQFGGVSCSGVIEEFKRALKEVSENSATFPIWQTIISKYPPVFIGDCEKAIKWASSETQKWLEKTMFNDIEDSKERSEKAKRVVEELSDHSKTYFHGRQYHSDECKKIGIKVIDLETLDKRQIKKCKDYQDCVLTVHHAYMQTLATTIAVKIVENHLGNAMILSQTSK